MSKRRQNWMRQADQLFARYVKERDGHCQHCGSVAYLQCAHLISRAYKSIRTHPDNAVALCRSCHVKFTHRPLEWQVWVDARFPGRLNRLRSEALRYERVDWKGRVLELRELVEEAA